ncbi:hypothetical protein KDAU_74290 [Dictyobacter aurantiacus]|uniref:Uncharacterized protein n=1 Tax=Dictyobacter aurantiacus TaxID=1936993 RepID=A0A401ZTJ5_9CHLR|nr:hypothetical protein KDAU_74290 [Dictyobacter aurantiacus]
MLCVRGGAQECGQLSSVDGGPRERREDVSNDALEIGVNVLGTRQRHSLQACPETISGSAVQTEQGALLC